MHPSNTFLWRIGLLRGWADCRLAATRAESANGVSGNLDCCRNRAPNRAAMVLDLYEAPALRASRSTAEWGTGKILRRAPQLRNISPAWGKLALPAIWAGDDGFCDQQLGIPPLICLPVPTVSTIVGKHMMAVN